MGTSSATSSIPPAIRRRAFCVASASVPPGFHGLGGLGQRWTPWGGHEGREEPIPGAAVRLYGPPQEPPAASHAEAPALPGAKPPALRSRSFAQVSSAVRSALAGECP